MLLQFKDLFTLEKGTIFTIVKDGHLERCIVKGQREDTYYIGEKKRKVKSVHYFSTISRDSSLSLETEYINNPISHDSIKDDNTYHITEIHIEPHEQISRFSLMMMDRNFSSKFKTKDFPLNEYRYSNTYRIFEHREDWEDSWTKEIGIVQTERWQDLFNIINYTSHYTSQGLFGRRIDYSYDIEIIPKIYRNVNSVMEIIKERNANE